MMIMPRCRRIKAVIPMPVRLFRVRVACGKSDDRAPAEVNAAVLDTFTIGIAAVES